MSSYRKTMGEVYNGMYLVEGNIDKIKDIVSKKSASKIDGVMVDMFTASAISQIYDKVNDANKKKMEKLPITKLAALAMKMMKNEYVPEEVDEKYDSDKFFGGKGTPEQRLQLLKLGNKALRALGGSPKQKEIQKEINALRKKMGMKVSEEVDLDEKKKEVVFKGTPAQIKKQMQNLKKKDKLKIGEEDDLDEDYVITVKDKEVNRYKSEKDARKAFSDLVQMHGRDVKVFKEEVELDEGSWHIAKNMNALKKKMQKPIPKGDLMVKFVMKHIGDDELMDAMFDAKQGTDMVPMIKSAMKRLNIKEEVEIDESGHTDVASAMTNVKVATSALTKMSGELSKLSPEDALPSWWTNKVAVAVDKLDGMADYLDTQVEEIELDELMPATKHVAKSKKNPDMFCVFDKDGNEVKLFKDKKDAEEYAVKNHDALNEEEVDLDEASKEGTIKIIKTKDGKFQIQKMTKGKFVDIGKPYNSAKEAEKFRSGQSNLFGEEVDLDEASARADAMKAMHKGKSVDPADVDTFASDDDVKAASKNIIMQLRKSVSLRGDMEVEFGDKKKVKVSSKIAQAVQNKFNKLRRPADKEKFQMQISKSYKDLLKAIKEETIKESKFGIINKQLKGEK